MKNKYVRISSKLYSTLYKKGGDKLLAVYCILKGSRNGEIKYYSYTSANNKTVSGYGLLRSLTCLTLHSIQIYVPTLISMGLCYVHENGDFVVLGGSKTKKEYGSKLVPIELGKNLSETVLNVMMVRVHSEIKQQNKQIKTKTESKRLIEQDNPQTAKELKKLKRLKKKYGTKRILVLDKTVMSNCGYAVLKDGTKNNKFKGSYWKSRLESKGLINTRRNFNRVVKMTYDQYLSYKFCGMRKYNQTYFNGWLVEETVSSIFIAERNTRACLALVG